MTDIQLASYLAGMIDYSSHFCNSGNSKMASLHLFSQSKKQILLVQKLFGGEIRGHLNTKYCIRFKKTAALKILGLVGPFIQAKRDQLALISQSYRVEAPLSVTPLIDFYIAGAIDAKDAFYCLTYGGRDYLTFSLPFYRECDRDYLAVNGQKEFRNSVIKFTANQAKAVLEKVRSFVLEYDKYHRAIHERVNEGFDPSILTSKDHTYYLAEQEAMRQAVARAKADKKAERQKKRDRKTIERKNRSMERAQERQKVVEQRQAMRLLGDAFLSDHENLLVFDKNYDRIYENLYRSKKKCRLCEIFLPLDYFHGAGGKAKHIDPLKSECKRCHHEKYVTPNLEVWAARSKAWQRANPEKAKAARKKQHRKPQVRIRNSLGNRVKLLLGRKSEKYCELIGCSPAHLTAHLESLFQPGMTWENYGEWHVDHKLPCRSFDLTDKAQRLECFNYTNLQPLWAEDNMKKADTLPNGEKARRVARAA